MEPEEGTCRVGGGHLSSRRKERIAQGEEERKRVDEVAGVGFSVVGVGFSMVGVRLSRSFAPTFALTSSISKWIVNASGNSPDMSDFNRCRGVHTPVFQLRLESGEIMSDRKKRLELTWIGKEDRPRLEPRILLEDSDLSYHSSKRISDHDIFENRLIHGDNLLALKALEQEFAGKIKCIYIDPPYNTGSAFTQYDDGLEHSIWLSLIRDRIDMLRALLREDGSLWISIDDNEAHYLKVLCDELFGRSNFIANMI